MAKTVTKKSNKTERIKDDYVTDIEGIESYETEKKQSGYQIKTKAAIDDVIFKDLREGNVSGISDNLQALIHDASPDDLVKLKNLFANHALANQVRTGSRKMTNSPTTGAKAATLTKTAYLAKTTRSKNTIYKSSY